MRYFSSTILLASALCAASAAAASDSYLKLGGVERESQDDKHKGQIEILSWSWGATQTSTTHAGGGMGAGKVSTSDLSAASAPAATEDAARKRPGRVKYGDITLKKEAADSNVVSPRDSQTGMASGKRQHQPMTVSKEWDATTPQLGRSAPPSAAAGSLTTLVPAGMCKAGATYPSAELGAAGRVYRLEGVTVAGCAAASAAEGRPMESISLNYTKISY